MGKRGKRADFVKTPVLFFLLMDVHGVVWYVVLIWFDRRLVHPKLAYFSLETHAFGDPPF
jgi:hypothetical protein